MPGLRVLRRTVRVRGWDLLVVAGLVGFVGGVYALVVIGGGRLTSSPDTPNAVLSVAATAMVAVGFDPVRRWLSARIARWSGRPGFAPSQVISRFLAANAAGATPEEATARMARAAVDGLGAEEARVWVRVSGRMRLSGAYPEPDQPEAAQQPEPPDITQATPGRLLRGISHGGELLGALSLRMPAEHVLTPVEEQLLDGLTASAGLVLRNLQLTAELRERYRDTTARAAALAESRRRVVALEDEERRLLERDIHDGAQQHLVALAVNLRVAHARLARASRSGGDLAEIVAGLQESANTATAELLDVVSGRGRLIAAQGLDAALRAVADTCPVPAHVVSQGVSRYPADVEQALFYCCAEALQNVAKHAHATQVTIELHGASHAVHAAVQDDGRGFTAPAETGIGAGRGLGNIAERIAAVGGTIAVRSAPGAGTRIDLWAPVPAVGGGS